MTKSFPFYLLLFAFFLDACHKDKVDTTPVPVGTIVADINGTKTSFNLNSIADTTTSFFDFYQNSFILSVTGTQELTSTPATIKIWFMKIPASAIGVGSYPDLNCRYTHTSILRKFGTTL